MGSEKMPIRRVAIEDTTTDRKDSGNNTRRSKNVRGDNRRASCDDHARHETYEERIQRKLVREGNSSQSTHLSASMNDANLTHEARLRGKKTERSYSEPFNNEVRDFDFSFSFSDETYEERDFASDERIAGKKISSEMYAEKVVRKSIAANYSQPQGYAIEESTEQTNHVAIEQQDSYDFQVSNICFDDVFADLQRFKQENDNSLTIPASHSFFLKIVDKLSSLGMENHQNKRWDHQFAGVKAFKREHGDCLIPPTHPTLGAWTATQSYHYKLFEQRLPSPLTKRRFRGLQLMGFDEFVNSKETNKNDAEAVKEEEEKHADVEAAESEAISKNFTLIQRMQSKKKATEAKLAAAEKAKNKDTDKNNTKAVKEEEERHTDIKTAESEAMSKSFTLNQKILLKKEATEAKLAAAEKARNKDTDGKANNKTMERGLQAKASSEKIPGKEAVAVALHQQREFRRFARGGLNRSALLARLAEDAKCDSESEGSEDGFFSRRKQLHLKKSELGGVLALAAMYECQEDEIT